MVGFRQSVNTLVVETKVDSEPQTVALESLSELHPLVIEHTKSGTVVAYGTVTVVSYSGI